MPESEVDLGKLFTSSEELDEPEVAKVQGKLPEWLRGKYLRVGPGLWDFGGFTMNHWLDGYAIITKFDIGGDTITFHKKYLQSDAYKRAMAAQKPVLTEFGTKAYPDPSKGLLSRLVSSIMPELSDNDNNNIFKLGKDYFVTNDGCFFRKFDPETLKSGDKFDAQRLLGLNNLSSHPMIDEKGDMYNIGSSALTGMKFQVIKIPAGDASKSSKEMLKDAKIICNIPSSYGAGCASYFHCFGMVDKWIVFIEQPFVASVSAIASALIKGLSVKEWLSWRPNELKNRFHLIDKETGKVMKTEITSDSPFFFTHIVNCYVEDEQIIIDIMAMDDPGMFDGMYLCKLRNNIVEDNSQASLRRFVIPLGNHKDLPLNKNLVNLKGTSATAIKTGNNSITLSHDAFTQTGCSMSTINEKYCGKPYQYIYANGTIADNEFMHRIGKINLKDRSCTYWIDEERKDSTFPGEPIMIPCPDSNGESDGVLITTLSNVKGDDILVFIDANSMKTIASATFKSQIPGAMHGMFIESV